MLQGDRGARAGVRLGGDRGSSQGGLQFELLPASAVPMPGASLWVCMMSHVVRSPVGPHPAAVW